MQQRQSLDLVDANRSRLGTDSEFWVIGHRGSPTTEIENTLPSFERALSVDGANGLELDLCVTGDREVVVWHDFDPNSLKARLRRWGCEPAVRCRPVGPDHSARLRPTSELTVAQLRENYGYTDQNCREGRLQARIPTLEMFMDWAIRQSALGIVFLDIKIPASHLRLLRILIEHLDRLVEQLRPKFKIVLECAEVPVLEELLRLAPRYDHTLDVEPHPGLVLNLEGASALEPALRYGLRFATAQKPRSITLLPFQTHRRIVRADLLKLKTHYRERQRVPVECLCSFTINEEQEMQTLIDLGVLAVQSDRPALLRKVWNARAAALEAAVPKLAAAE